jgi:hypothetical protein
LRSLCPTSGIRLIACGLLLPTLLDQTLSLHLRCAHLLAALLHLPHCTLPSRHLLTALLSPHLLLLSHLPLHLLLPHNALVVSELVPAKPAPIAPSKSTSQSQRSFD